MNHRVKQFRPACDSVAISRPDTNGIATAQFKVSKFAGDNYVIKATIYHDDGPAIKTRTWKSKPLTVWKKFKVQQDAMKCDSAKDRWFGGPDYRVPLTNCRTNVVQEKFRQVFIELEFQPIRLSPGPQPEFRDWVSQAGPLNNPEKLFHTNTIWNPALADLHLIGVAAIEGDAEVHATRSVHAAIAYWKNPPWRVTSGSKFDEGRWTMAVAHELGHTLLGTNHWKHPTEPVRVGPANEIMIFGAAGQPLETGDDWGFVTSAYAIRGTAEGKGIPQPCSLP